MPEHEKMLVSLDRIEEGIAVLLLREGHIWLMPDIYLPEGSREGDVFEVTLKKNPEETGKLAGSIHNLQQRLLDRTRERNKTSNR